MENLSTSGSSRRSSFELRPKPQPKPKYNRIFENTANYSPSERIKVNTRAIVVLKCENHDRMKKSYLFKFCRPQEYNERFLNTFADFFQHLRGSEPLAMSAGYALANKFREYKDVCDTNWEFNHDDHINRWEVIHSPTPEVIQELKQIIEEEHGLKDFFFETLQKNHFRISEEFKLEDRDTFFREFPIFPRVYPRCANVLKDVFTDLLSVKWLENDINGLKYYLDQNTSIERPLDLGKLLEAERVWKLVKQAVEAKINHDEKLNKHFYDELKKDIKNLGISSLVSLVPGCGAAFLGGIGRTVINTLGNYADPEGKQTSVQMMKLLGGSGLGKLMGGDVFELGTSMGIDLVEFYVRDEKITKNEGTALSIYTSALKGLFTGDKQKLIAQILGTCVAETAERVDEKDAPLDIKIILALLKNPDARGLIVNDLVNEFSKEKPKVSGILNTEEQELNDSDTGIPVTDNTEQPTAEQLAEYEKQLAEYEQWQKDSAAQTLAETNAKNELIQKEAGVTNAEKYLKDKTNAFNKKVGFFHFAAKESQKLDKAQENKRTAVSERDTAQKKLDDIQGIVRVPAPKPKAPKPKTVVGKVWKWTKENVSAGGEVTVTSVPLYQTKAPQSSYSDTQHQIMIESAQLPSIEQISQPRPNMGQWEGVQAMQRDQMFEMNMAYRSPVMQNSQPSPLNYQLFWGQGLANNVQMPPMDLSNLGRSDPEHRIPGMKHYPDGDRTQSNIPKWLRYFASAGETLDPQERIDRNTQSLVATTKVAGQAFGEIADELRSFGCVNARFKDGKVTLRFDRTISSQIDGLMNQYLPNMDHVPHFRYVEFTARIANDVMLEAFMMPLFQAQKAG